MATIQDIQKQLESINETVFQDLCDELMHLEFSNIGIGRTGSMLTKQKTTRGTPDSYLVLYSGNFLFSEVTANISNKNKLKNDIIACFELKKSKIPAEKIEKILLCFNFEIDQSKVLELQTFAQQYNPNVEVIFWSIEKIAQLLKNNHNNLISEYLGLNFDTGQIVSILSFINSYNKKTHSIATPLDNYFIPKPAIEKEIIESIHKNDFTIITGNAGVGKTKLALEVINGFIESSKDNYTSYVIENKSASLLDDLSSYFYNDKNYILFVDDANRIDTLSQIIGAYRGKTKGVLKIVLTVRKYAFEGIQNQLTDYTPNTIVIETSTDEEIKEIITKEPFKIINTDYQEKILNLANGNPRLAIMASRIAKKEQRLFSLSNVAEMYEKYFSHIDLKLLSLDIKVLGVLSFFKTLPKESSILNPILEKFNINYEDFINSLENLEELELLEIRYEYIKISEQTIADYFFYKAFIKDKVLNFQDLLENFFETNFQNFKDSLIPVSNSYGKLVSDILIPIVRKHWRTIKYIEKNHYEFLNFFSGYLYLEILELVYLQIEQLPNPNKQEYITEYEDNDVKEDDNTMNLLSHFFHTTDEKEFIDILNLFFGYIKKKPELYPKMLFTIKNRLVPNYKEKTLYRQKILFEYIIEKAKNGDNFFRTLFFSIVVEFLSVSFEDSSSGRGNTMHIYTIKILNSSLTTEFRTFLWNSMIELLKTDNILFKKIFTQYIQEITTWENEEGHKILRKDYPFLLELIEKYCSSENFEDTLLIHKFIETIKRREHFDEKFKELEHSYKTDLYNFYKDVSWDRLKDKEVYDYDNTDKYDQLKTKSVIEKFSLASKKEIDFFYNQYQEVFPYLRSYNKDLIIDIIISECFQNSQKLGFYLLKKLFSRNHYTECFRANWLFEFIKNKKNFLSFLKFLSPLSFIGKENWILMALNIVDEKFLEVDHLNLYIENISSLKGIYTFQHHFFKKSKKIDPSFEKKILQLILKINKDNDAHIYIDISYFLDSKKISVELLQKLYIQQYLRNDHFDYKWEGFFSLLKKDITFLSVFILGLDENKKLENIRHIKGLGKIWDFSGVEKEVEELFKYSLSKKPFFILNDFTTLFFSDISLGNRSAGKFIEDYLQENFRDLDKVNLLVHIATKV